MSELDRVTQAVAERAPQLVLYARQWLDASAAEDAVQEALTALLTERSRPSDPIAWMFRAVRNAAIDRGRASWRRRRREEIVASQRVEWFESRVESLIDAHTAEQALRQLSPDLREVVVLRIWGEMGFAQIADIMQLSVSTVHERYTSALAQLRSRLEDPCRSKTT